MKAAEPQKIVKENLTFRYLDKNDHSKTKNVKAASTGHLKNDFAI